MRKPFNRPNSMSTVLAILSLAACHGESTGPGLESGMLTFADVEGSWIVQVPRTVACLPNRDPFTLRLDLRHSSLAAFVGVEGEEYFGGSWRVEPGGADQVLQGWVDMTTRTFRFLLWQGVHEKGSVFQGRFLAGGHLSASIEEPVPPGEGWAADPIPGYPGGFAIGACQWRVEGVRGGS